MGTMVGSGRKRKFGSKTYYHFGNSDDKEEAKEFASDIRIETGASVKVTGDYYGGGDIWVSDKKLLTMEY